MDTHKNARLTPKGREQMVRAVGEQGLSNAAAARRFNTTPKTVAKWVARFGAQGVDGLARPLLEDPFHRHARSRPTPPMRSRDCAASAASRSTLRPRSASPRPASRAFSSAAASVCSPASSHRSHAPATSARNPARSSISTSRSSAASTASATASVDVAAAGAAAKAPAGNTPTWRSTITRASPAPTSSRTRRRRAPSPSSSPPSPTSKASASRSSVS